MLLVGHPVKMKTTLSDFWRRDFRFLFEIFFKPEGVHFTVILLSEHENFQFRATTPEKIFCWVEKVVFRSLVLPRDIWEGQIKC